MYPNNGVLVLGITKIQFSKAELTIFYFLKTLFFIYNSLIVIDSEDSFLDIIYAMDSLKLPNVLVNIFLCLKL